MTKWILCRTCGERWAAEEFTAAGNAYKRRGTMAKGGLQCNVCYKEAHWTSHPCAGGCGAAKLSKPARKTPWWCPRCLRNQRSRLRCGECGTRWVEGCRWNYKAGLCGTCDAKQSWQRHAARQKASSRARTGSASGPA